MAELRQAGVYATLDEFKGRVPLERDGVSMPLGDGDFDNPLIAGHYWGATGGSRGTSRRVAVDLGRFEHEAGYQALFRDGFGLDGRPFGIYRVIPPSRAGLQNPTPQDRLPPSPPLCGRPPPPGPADRNITPPTGTRHHGLPDRPGPGRAQGVAAYAALTRPRRRLPRSRRRPLPRPGHGRHPRRTPHRTHPRHRGRGRRSGS